MKNIDLFRTFANIVTCASHTSAAVVWRGTNDKTLGGAKWVWWMFIAWQELQKLTWHIFAIRAQI